MANAEKNPTLKLGNCRSSLHSDHESLAGEQGSQDKGSVSKLKDLFWANFTGQKGISPWESQRWDEVPGVQGQSCKRHMKVMASTAIFWVQEGITGQQEWKRSRWQAENVNVVRDWRINFEVLTAYGLIHQQDLVIQVQIYRPALIELRPNSVTKRAKQLNRNLRCEAAVERTDRAAHTGKMTLGEIIQLGFSALATFPLQSGKSPEAWGQNKINYPDLL